MPHRQSNWGPLVVTDTVPRKTPDGRKVWVNFIPNIDLGHLITMVSFAIGLATTWNIQDRRITVTEQKLMASEQQTAEMRTDLKEIKKILEEVQRIQAVQAFVLNSSNNAKK